jgi:putative effector of murein hydrolase
MALAWCLGGETLLPSLTTKSVTTPIALGLANIIGSVPELVATVVIFTGVVGAMLGPVLLRRLGISDERILGFSLGLNAHGVGTARAFEISPRCGAWASLAMGLTGLLTTALLPLVVRLLY